MMDAGAIQSTLQNAFPEAQIQVLGDDGVHFEAQIVSPQFAGKSPIARHRMVYAALGDAMESAIHALSIKAIAPDEL